ncbi:hypothetical protein IRJ41_002898 [Triplophysa rosa]|uniref:Uncharacterized protein n=1 Tax=Triplophysa rosa TaxID=992332 RepID=A0A9W7TE71_TRIRA|nr:hypothetical protein IRJ41_002898 [Triplophysa rosa]
MAERAPFGSHETWKGASRGPCNANLLIAELLWWGALGIRGLAGLRPRLRKAAPAVVNGASAEWRRKALSLRNNPAFVELLEAISQKSNDRRLQI